jgi:hypothetical protein
MVRRNEVPYDGYRAAVGAPEPAARTAGDPSQGARRRVASANDPVEPSDIPF